MGAWRFLFRDPSDPNIDSKTELDFEIGLGQLFQDCTSVGGPQKSARERDVRDDVRTPKKMKNVTKRGSQGNPRDLQKPQKSKNAQDQFVSKNEKS